MEISPVGAADETGHRTIVVALDTEIESLRALDWVQNNFYKPGDILHMVHVCTCMASPMEVFHGVPGTSLHVPDPEPHREASELAFAREFFMGRVKDQLDKAGIQWDLHLFADTVTSDATDIGMIIQKTAEKVQAALVVLAHHDNHEKAKQGYFYSGPGSVARVCESLNLPLAVIP